MEFPGNNELKLSNETVTRIISEHVRVTLMGGNVRVTHISKSSYSGDLSVTVDFTSDPDPDKPSAGGETGAVSVA